ncbi:uncharacterized protein LOC100214985 [Hydra vulgaris]|uniref:chitinase n=1 Tax=Hydra vulgaris TaxID=6087 RepID=A0ABM4CPI5_HYDVU
MYVALCILVVALFGCVSGNQRHKIVAYWGQNAVYNELKERQYWEKELVDFCKDYNYDIIALSFLNNFFDEKNKDKMPGFNFAFHCETPIASGYKTLFRCPLIEEGIKECQKRGKQVIMSLGGAVGRAGFGSENDAKLFAYRVYHLLLEGTDLQSLRPFGSAVLNGVDLDIENGGYTHYTVFVKELRRLEKTGSQKILIGAAPQCPYPDSLLGPSPGRVLGDVPELVDEIYIQFYNNWCHTGNTKVFDDHMKQWLTHSRKHNGPKIFIGVPANTRASGNPQHYRNPQELTVIYNKYKNEPLFGGIMFWDASFDQNNVISGKRFSEHIGNMFNNVGPIPTGDPITLPPYTGPQTKTHGVDTTVQKTTSGLPTTKPSSVSCNGLSDGIYPHPSDCTLFFECSGSIAYLKGCPPGLKYNAALKLCDWPDNVKC